MPQRESAGGTQGHLHTTFTAAVPTTTTRRTQPVPASGGMDKRCALCTQWNSTQPQQGDPDTCYHMGETRGCCAQGTKYTGHRTGAARSLSHAVPGADTFTREVGTNSRGHLSLGDSADSEPLPGSQRSCGSRRPRRGRDSGTNVYPGTLKACRLTESVLCAVCTLEGPGHYISLEGAKHPHPSNCRRTETV